MAAFRRRLGRVVPPYNDVPPRRTDILNVGGFSDAVFNVIGSCLSDDAGMLIAEVEAIEL